MSYSVVVGVIDVVDDDDCDENDVFVICFVVDCYKLRHKFYLLLP